MTSKSTKSTAAAATARTAAAATTTLMYFIVAIWIFDWTASHICCSFLLVSNSFCPIPTSVNHVRRSQIRIRASTYSCIFGIRWLSHERRKMQFACRTLQIESIRFDLFCIQSRKSANRSNSCSYIDSGRITCANCLVTTQQHKRVQPHTQHFCPLPSRSLPKWPDHWSLQLDEMVWPSIYSIEYFMWIVFVCVFISWRCFSFIVFFFLGLLRWKTAFDEHVCVCVCVCLVCVCTSAHELWNMFATCSQIS